uniref:Uncharacterized protein n=1 Tax=Anguilla anguilla TaxID=7936 RepID=A0A0E9VQ93_ANGAN
MRRSSRHVNMVQQMVNGPNTQYTVSVLS